MSRATQGSATLRMASHRGLSPAMAPLSRGSCSPSILRHRGPTTPVRPEPHWFGLFPVRSPLLGESLLFSLPTGTKMFQFPAFASLILRMTVLQTAGLSHSEIPGSKVICTSPGLVAAYHVLHRLREPRHPPYALSYFLRLVSYHLSLMERPIGYIAHTFSCIEIFFSTVLSVTTCQRSFCRVWSQECGVLSSESLSTRTIVENNGFEPLTSCMPCKRSSQLS